MSNRHKISRLVYLVLALVLCTGISFSVWLLARGLEGKPPTLTWETPLGPVGLLTTLKGIANDRQSGLKRIWVALLQDGKEHVLTDQSFPAKGLLRRGTVRQKHVLLKIRAEVLGLHDGEAIFRMAVWDYSYRGWLSGNQYYNETKVVIDTRPPSVDMVTRVHNLNQGGAGLAIYRVTEPVSRTGIQVADRFFPALAGYFDDGEIFTAFFALPYDKGPETQLYITATDKAGNTGRTGFAYHINAKAFTSDTIRISRAFLERKMPEFEKVEPGRERPALLDTFLWVNRQLRRSNYETVQAICSKSDAEKHWAGPFVRLPASARKAGFAERRTYQYNGKIIDKQVHMGVDLASTAHCPVPTANNGRIAFAEGLGIYGRTVIVDHGFYLFSMYSHLSQILVRPKQMVSKGDIIGFSGNTGLAGGDHLHFAMLIHDTFVNPIEWWDPKWIEHNITNKLKSATRRISSSNKETSQ